MAIETAIYYMTAIASDGEDLKIRSAYPDLQSSTLCISDSLDDWPHCIDPQYHGVLVKRPRLCDGLQIQADIDLAADSERFWDLEHDVVNLESEKLSVSLESVAEDLLAHAALPASLSEIIRSDICSIGQVVGRMCSFAGQLQIKLEILGESVCSRWHRDNYVGRAIVTYNSHGTEYTDDSNVDFWELENCGNNQCVIQDTKQVQHAEVGDILFMKGQQFPNSSGLVHKSPEKRYHENGCVVNRLVLKIDVP